MAQEMTSHERLRRVYDHQEPDRLPLTDSPWGVTVERWRTEGLPADANVGDSFGFEKTDTGTRVTDHKHFACASAPIAWFYPVGVIRRMSEAFLADLKREVEG
jgi:hypothetical protein